MKKDPSLALGRTTRRFTLAACAAASLALSAPGVWAQAANPLKIGLLSDMSGFVADLSGPGSVVAAKNPDKVVILAAHPSLEGSGPDPAKWIL